MSLTAVLRRAIAVLGVDSSYVSLVEDLQRELDELEGKALRGDGLPRCRHGKALRDHGGSALEPPCGCKPEHGAFVLWRRGGESPDKGWP